MLNPKSSITRRKYRANKDYNSPAPNPTYNTVTASSIVSENFSNYDNYLPGESNLRLDTLTTGTLSVSKELAVLDPDFKSGDKVACSLLAPNAPNSTSVYLYLGKSADECTSIRHKIGDYSTIERTGNLGAIALDKGGNVRFCNNYVKVYRDIGLGIGKTPTVPLDVLSTGVGTYVMVSRFLATANTTQGNTTSIQLGVNSDPKNAVELRYTYNANQSDTNHADVGFTDCPYALRLYPTGDVSIAGKLHVAGGITLHTSVMAPTAGQLGYFQQAVLSTNHIYGPSNSGVQNILTLTLDAGTYLVRGALYVKTLTGSANVSYVELGFQTSSTTLGEGDNPSVFRTGIPSEVVSFGSYSQQYHPTGSVVWEVNSDAKRTVHLNFNAVLETGTPSGSIAILANSGFTFLEAVRIA